LKDRKLIAIFGILGVLAIAGGAIVKFSGYPVVETFTQWSQALAQWGVIPFALAYVVAALLSLPCSPLTLAAGATFGVWLGGWGAVLGTAGGAAAGYLISRHLARERFAHALAANPRFRQIDEAIGREGWKIIALLRLCPLPFGVSNYLYGLTAVRFWPYLLASVVGMLPGNFLFAYVGAAGRYSISEAAEGRHGVQTYVPLALSVFALVSVTMILRRIALRATAARERVAAAAVLAPDPNSAISPPQ
jgi:uncharacterized membrane protein YdjX (TVP38/TMEM64 family)